MEVLNLVLTGQIVTLMVIVAFMTAFAYFTWAKRKVDFLETSHMTLLLVDLNLMNFILL